LSEPADRPDAFPPAPPVLPQDADFDTRVLFAGRSEIRIAHENMVYRLRITRAGKLILNK